MNLEEKYEELAAKFKRDALVVVDEAINTLHCDIAPHLETDTDANVYHQAGELVRGMLGGNFERVDENTVMVSAHCGISIPITLTTMQYDSIRKSLLEMMPACPKDLKIKSLESRLADVYDRKF